MEQNIASCAHRWRYFVHVQSRSVRARTCERCGRRDIVSARLSAPSTIHEIEPRAVASA